MAADRILVVYRTGEGQTRKIADRIADRLRAAGAGVDISDAADASSPRGYAGAVLGDSIHYSRHSKELTAYATAHADALRAMPSAVFQVCMASAGTNEKDRATARGLLDPLLQKAGWTPDVVGLFAGALAYPQYGWFVRVMLRLIAKRQGLSTDTSRSHEYTDWGAVDAFADDVLAAISARTRPTP
jgi:menaquinone-dependent protoporphyrinogen oxidase